jgi:superfamily II DNA or RNA helicase
MRLRTYQTEAIQAVIDARARGIRRPLISLPTGTGKSVIFASLPKAMNVNGATVILANRDVLVSQAEAHFKRAAPEAWVDVEKAERRASPFARIVVASVQSLGAERLADFLTRFPKRIELLIIDEAHHATAKSYRAIADGVCKIHSDAIVVGVTATPGRGDGVGLGEVFDEIVYARDIRWAVDDGWLVPIRSYVVRTRTDLSGVRVRGDDFVVKELEGAVDTEDRNARIVSAYQQHVFGKRAVVFTADVAHAHHVAGTFLGAGIPALALSGRTPDCDRQKAYADFRAARLLVLTCAQLLTEGWDETALDVVIQARPMRSQAMYIQATGRALRPIDDVAARLSDFDAARDRCRLIAESSKPFATILDVVDEGQHSLVTVASLNGLPPKVDLQGRNPHSVGRSFEELKEKAPWLGERVVSADEIETLLHEINAFGQGLIPPPTDLPWKIQNDQYVLNLPRQIDGERNDGSIEANVYGKLRSVMNAHSRDRGKPLGAEAAARRLGYRRVIYRAEKLQIRQVDGRWSVIVAGGADTTTLGRRTTLSAAFADARSWVEIRRPTAAAKPRKSA